MSKKIAGPEIERLVQLLARLPGLGPRSARKAALAEWQNDGDVERFRRPAILAGYRAFIGSALQREAPPARMHGAEVRSVSTGSIIASTKALRY